MFKKWLWLTLGAVSFSLMAEKGQGDDLMNHPTSLPPQKYSIGLHTAHYKYAEPDFMESKGYVYGASFYAKLPLHAEMFFKLEANYDQGKTDYTGSGTKKGDPVSKLDLRAMAAEDYEFDDVTLTPYIGLGYRYLYNDARGITSTGHYGYRRVNKLLYIPAGIDYRLPLMGVYTVFNAECDVLLHGRQESYLQDVGPGYGLIENDQHSGYALRLGAQVEYKNISFGPYLEYWHIDCSDVGYSDFGDAGVEPDNRTTEIGFEIRYQF